jgi:isocitrate lyase
LCCEKLKVELRKVISELKSELKSAVEIAKVLKEDQEQLSRKVNSIECSSVNMVNTVSKAGSNAVRLTGWKTVSRHKRRAKIDTDSYQQLKIPTVVNCFAALDNLKEGNSVPQCQNLKLKPTVKKLTTKVHSAKKKVMIIGDSHARGCAANLIHECGKSFEVMGNVILGSGLLNITQAAKKRNQ